MPDAVRRNGRVLIQKRSVLAAGGLAPDHSRWISSRRSFFLPIKVFSRMFLGKFVAGLKSPRIFDL
jgi:hypothetical protein